MKGEGAMHLSSPEDEDWGNGITHGREGGVSLADEPEESLLHTQCQLSFRFTVYSTVGRATGRGGVWESSTFMPISTSFSKEPSR